MSILEDPRGKETEVLHDLVDFGGRRVLEVGCGNGRLTWRYAEKASSVVGIDPDGEDVAAARANLPDSLGGRVEFVEASILDFVLRPGEPRFDLALLGWSL